MLHIHRLPAVGKIEASALLRLLLLLIESESCLSRRNVLRHIPCFFLVGEIFADDVERLHVDILVHIVLTVVDFLHSTCFFDDERKMVHILVGRILRRILVHLSNFEDVFQAIQCDLDDLVVGAGQKVTQGLDAPLSNEVADLFWFLKTSRSRIRNGPASLFAGLEIAIGEKMDERWNDTSVNDSLDLCGIASGDIRYGPTSLLPNPVFLRAQQSQQGRQCTTVDNDLRLQVVTGNDVTNGSKSGRLN